MSKSAVMLNLLIKFFTSNIIFCKLLAGLNDVCDTPASSAGTLRWWIVIANPRPYSVTGDGWFFSQMVKKTNEGRRLLTTPSVGSDSCSWHKDAFDNSCWAIFNEKIVEQVTDFLSQLASSKFDELRVNSMDAGCFISFLFLNLCDSFELFLFCRRREWS